MRNMWTVMMSRMLLYQRWRNFRYDMIPFRPLRESAKDKRPSKVQ